MTLLYALTPIEHVMKEVSDSTAWTFLTHLGGDGWHVPLYDFGLFHLTRFMILEVVIAGLLITIFVPLARRAARQPVPVGPWWNAFEALLTFIRDEVARPTLSAPAGHHGEHHEGHHGPAHAGPPGATVPTDYDVYVPFLWTAFLFVLFCNLMGLVPMMGSPTASIWVTGALAVCSFIMMHGAAIARWGFIPYVKSLWPHMEIPFGMGIVLKPMILIIELLGTVIKATVLAVRLFANLFAGHMVLGMILYFIVLAANSGQYILWGGITVASVLGVVALSLLELFVAFLQAYIFVFLTALFMGMALHPQH
jgi:F-type H+-transporting ATPase subunit a